MKIKQYHISKNNLRKSLEELKELRNTKSSLSEDAKMYLDKQITEGEALLKESESEAPGFPLWECMKWILKKNWKPLLTIHVAALLPLLACYGSLKEKLIGPKAVNRYEE